MRIAALMLVPPFMRLWRHRGGGGISVTRLSLVGPRGEEKGGDHLGDVVAEALKVQGGRLHLNADVVAELDDPHLRSTGTAQSLGEGPGRRAACPATRSAPGDPRQPAVEDLGRGWGR